MSQAPAKLGIIAGVGPLPRRIAEFCLESGRACQVVGLEGQTDPKLYDGVPFRSFRMGAAGAMLSWLRDGGVSELVMAGAVRRPSLSELKPDWRAAKFFAKIGAKALGDDGLLSAVISELEKEGFRLVAVDSLLGDLLSRAGPYGAVQPTEEDWADIQRGVDVARGIGSLDVGQGVVVQQGLILAVEAIEGTDAMVERAGRLARDGRGGLLVKVKKPGQERRADLPTIGKATVANAAAAGLRGIAVEAGGALVIDAPSVAAAADAAGLFVVGIGIDGAGLVDPAQSRAASPHG